MESDFDDVGMDRRGFLKVSAASVGMLSLGGGTAAAQQLASADVDSAAMLIGPSENLPEPGGPFFQNKRRYHYIYWVTDDSGQWEITESDDEWRLIPGSRARMLDALLGTETVSNTMAETTVFESAINPNTILTGDVYSLMSTGTYTTVNSTEQFTIRFYLEDTELASIQSVQSNVNNRPWYVELQLTVKAVNGDGQLQPHTIAVFNNVHDDQHHAEVTLDTTITETFSMTVEWDEANSGDDVTVRQAIFERLGTA